MTHKRQLISPGKEQAGYYRALCNATVTGKQWSRLWKDVTCEKCMNLMSFHEQIRQRRVKKMRDHYNAELTEKIIDANGEWT